MNYQKFNKWCSWGTAWLGLCVGVVTLVRDETLSPVWAFLTAYWALDGMLPKKK